MTHDRTNPPPDEIMGKVVAKWKGWDDSIPVGKGLWNDSHMLVQGKPPYDNATEDPRDDPNAALELLHWLVNRTQGIGFWWKPKSWVFDLPTGNIDVPISGQPMRTAVCWLAAEVLGVEDA